MNQNAQAKANMSASTELEKGVVGAIAGTRTGKVEMVHNTKASPSGNIAQLIASNSLHMVMQPIVDLVSTEIYGHEALVRGPANTPLASPDTLLKLAAQEDCLLDFELECVKLALSQWKSDGNGGRIFVNVSASALARAFQGYNVEAMAKAISDFGISPRSVIFEITEHEHISDIPNLLAVAQDLRHAGIRFALDDFGDGRSSLRLWAELAPDIVKIDKYFTKDISRISTKTKTIRSLMQLAENFNSALVAEGIETAEDLHALRDLGIQLGQGYYLGRPDRSPAVTLPSKTRLVLQQSRVSILPTQASSTRKINLRGSIVMHVPPATELTTTSDVVQLFVDHPTWHAIPVVDGTRPIGIIGRAEMLTQSAKPYFYELFGKRSCMRYTNTAPRLVEVDQNVQDLIGILTSEDQRYLSEGFIFTENGQYRGIGLGEHLVRLVTESRIEAARHANPLTFLPGNIPISEHINRLLERNSDFIVAYADLANFKPFNDFYGYWQGDEVIKLVAATLLKHIDRTADFLGHVGGDDFLVVFQSVDWRDRLENAIAEFNSAVIRLHDKEAIDAGGIWAEDRHGVRRFFPCTTLYAGAVDAARGPYKNASDVSSAAAKARHLAKKDSVAIYLSPVPHPQFEDSGHHAL